MTSLSFYPGCALQHMSRDYRDSIVEVTGALGIQLEEIPDWTCCGASAAHNLDERMSVGLPARNLSLAASAGRDVAVACPMCFQRLSLTKQMLLRERVENPWPADYDFEVVDLARLLSSERWIERIGERVVSVLDGLRVVCYYGCQPVRPPRITGARDYPNPLYLDRIVTATGAHSMDWSFKTTCCGAGTSIPRKDIGLRLIGKLLSRARASGAQAVVVCCPLCQSNLDLHQHEILLQEGLDPESAALPVLYYTELLGIAFGLPAARKGLKRHLVDPLPLVQRIAG